MDSYNRLLNGSEKDEAFLNLLNVELFIQSNKITGERKKRFGILSDLSRVTGVFLYDHPYFVEKYGDGFQTETGIFINATIFMNFMQQDYTNKSSEDMSVSLILNSLCKFYLSNNADKNELIPKTDLKCFFSPKADLNLVKINEVEFKDDLVKCNLLNSVKLFYGKELDNNEVKDFVDAKLAQINNVIAEYKINDLRSDKYMLVESAIDNKFLTTIQSQKTGFSTEVNRLKESDFDKENKKALDIFISNVLGIKENNIEDYNKEVVKEINKYVEVIMLSSLYSFQKAISDFEHEIGKSTLKDNLMFGHNLFKGNDGVIYLEHDFKIFMGQIISNNENYTTDHRTLLINSLAHVYNFDTTKPKLKIK